MKLKNLIALLLFMIATAWTITRSPAKVREIQRIFYSCVGSFISEGSALEKKIRAFNDEIEHSTSLKKQLDELKIEVILLRTKAKEVEQLAVENDRLRDALKFPLREKFSAVTANVLRRNPSTWWKTAIIDRGLEDDILDSFPVISTQGLVGKIEMTNERESTLLLLTDEKCQVSAKIAGTHEVGILNGQRTQSGDTPLLRLRFLSPNAKIQQGMQVFTTGRGGLFPPDILLGTIEKYQSSTFDAEAIVRPAVDFNQLHTVFILTNSPS